MREWSFLTNHATALLCVAENPGMTLRQVGDYVGITERAAHRIVSDLVEDGYLMRKREGRRNRYEVRPDVPLRDPLLRGRTVGHMLSALPVDLSRGSHGATNGGAVLAAPSDGAAVLAEPAITR